HGSTSTRPGTMPPTLTAISTFISRAPFVAVTPWRSLDTRRSGSLCATVGAPDGATEASAMQAWLMRKQRLREPMAPRLESRRNRGNTRHTTDDALRHVQMNSPEHERSHRVT